MGYIFFKRLLDVFFASFLLLMMSPLFLMAALLIKLTSPGPIFYQGVRVGQGGRKFRMLKFRTMIVDAEKKGASSTAEGDPRLTSVGRFLRRYKLDEWPQLINVLLGQMSLVGPRPQVEWAVALYSERERLLLSVPPGITDYASIKFRDEARILAGSNNPDQSYLEKVAPDKIRLGLQYVQKRSLKVDLKIILATAASLSGFSPEWVFKERHEII